jgi:glycosyltransferase involved in cell wall biosynthesis
LYLLVRKIIKKHSVDIIEAPDFFGILAFWPALPIPIVVRLHGSAALLATAMNHQINKNIFRNEMSTLRKATFLVSVSAFAAEQTRRIFGLQSPITVIYNSVKVGHQESKKSRDPYGVLFSGSLARIKGVFSLIDAWPDVLKIFPHAKLQMFGKDTPDENGRSTQSLLRERLSPSCAESVVFYEHVDRARILAELETATVAIFPSFSEAFALAPLEAMSKGCPTIFTKRSSGTEIIEDGKNGLLIDPSNPQEIALAITAVLSNPSLAAELGAQGRRTIESRFEDAKILSKNELMYSDVVKHYRAQHHVC